VFAARLDTPLSPSVVARMTFPRICGSLGRQSSINRTTPHRTPKWLHSISKCDMPNDYNGFALEILTYRFAIRSLPYPIAGSFIT
jgi:hypothetical protein